jgi:hypothetical protein
MAEQPPRRYITRSRVQTGDSTASSVGPVRNTRSTIATGKRKALNESTLTHDNSRSKAGDTKPAQTSSRATRIPTKAAVPIAAATKKPPTRTRSAVSNDALTAAPRRSGRTGNKRFSPYRRVEGQIDAKTIIARTLAHKKVTFAPDPKAPTADKENALPSKSKPDEKEETDELMSSSISALSVKPKRIPKTKLQQPSTGVFAEALPHLSPQKARRPKRLHPIEDEEDMRDELLCPTSPRLAEKPRRPLPSIGKKSAIDGAELLLKTKESAPVSALFGTPAKRFPQSPEKARELVPSFSIQASTSKPSALSSPARRPIGKPKLGVSTSNPMMKGSSLKFTMNATDDTFSDNTIHVAADMRDDVFGSKPIPKKTTIVKKDTVEGPKKVETLKSINPPPAFFDMLSDIRKKREADSNTPKSLKSNVKKNSTTPLTSPPFRVGDAEGKIDWDGDISMDGDEGSCETSPTPAAQASATVTKHHSPSEGGSSFGLGMDDDDDDMDCDSENVPPRPPSPPQATINPGQLRRENWDNDVPVDPMLLSQDTSDVVDGYTEVSAPKKTVPVKFHSDGDDVFGGEPLTLNGRPISELHPITLAMEAQRRVRSIEKQPSTVFAGAVVYVDAYTNDGHECRASFENLLEGMGAKVLQQWNWNPDSATPGKVAITHVVFKDGSPRTLAKVKAAKGLVSCVALGWVVECAKVNRWLDESPWAINLDDIPRGGKVCTFCNSVVVSIGKLMILCSVASQWSLREWKTCSLNSRRPLVLNASRLPAVANRSRHRRPLRGLCPVRPLRPYQPNLNSISPLRTRSSWRKFAWPRERAYSSLLKSEVL